MTWPWYATVGAAAYAAATVLVVHLGWRMGADAIAEARRDEFGDWAKGRAAARS